MKKYFAATTSEGPDLANLQLLFWRLAVEQFERIKGKWHRYAIEDPNDADPEYGANDFVEDAAVAIILAGTSMSELIGQNVPADGDKTPYLRPALKSLIGDPIPQYIEDFITIYDGLRHFGEAKYELVNSITEDSLCEYMTSAQKLWHYILQMRSRPITTDFTHTFELS